MASDTTHYAIEAFAADGVRLSLNEDRKALDILVATNIWEAIAILSNVPANGWTHWDDGESEKTPIASLVLRHYEMRRTRAGAITFSANTLETIIRHP